MTDPAPAQRPGLARRSEPQAGALWHVYVVRCADGSLYTGVARDVQARVAEHNAGRARGARYTRGRLPVALLYREPWDSRAQALRREHAIKRLSKRAKEALVRPGS